MATTTSSADDADECPAAALAAESARIVRVITTKNSNEVLNALGEDTLPTTDYVRAACYARLDALAALAPHVEAQSAKGALFQAWIAQSHFSHLEDHATGGTPIGARDRLGKLGEHVEALDLLLTSAVRYLRDQVAGDDDVATLDRWFDRADVGRVIDRLAAA